MSATAIAYAQLTKQDIPFVFNRKEAKDHGEGGLLVGAPLNGNVIILDDVITAGTSARESIDIISKNGAIPAGMLIALDRQEKGENDISIIQELKQNFNLPVISIITLADIVEYLKCDRENMGFIDAVSKYQQAYGAS